MNNRLDYIDITKGIAIFLMVCGHTTLPQSVSNWIWSFHMPLFFIISGFLYNHEKYNTFGSFLKRRFKTLLVPYLFFSLIVIVIATNLPGINANLKHVILYGWGSYPLWFVPVLFSTEVISNRLVNYAIGGGKLLIICIAISLVGYMLWRLDIRLPYNQDAVPWACLFYCVGYLSKGLIKQLSKWWIAVIAFLLNVVFSQINPRVDMCSNQIGSFLPCTLNAIVGTLAVIIIAKHIASHCVFKPFKLFFVWAGQNTFIILGLSAVINMAFLKPLFETFSLSFYANAILRHTLLWCVLFILSIALDRYVPFFVGKVNKDK